MTVSADVSEQSRATVTRLYGLAGVADWAGMAEVLAPGIVLHEPSSLPYGGEYRGLDEVVAALRHIFTDVLDMTKLEVQAMLADGPRVVSVIGLGGTVRATGKAFDMTLLESFELDSDGMITSISPYWWDTAVLAESFQR